jgi:hypothetical protein
MQATWTIVGMHNESYNADDSTWKRPPASVDFHDSSSITISNCKFIHLGGVGAAFDRGSQYCSIISSEFTDISGGAIMVSNICRYIFLLLSLFVLFSLKNLFILFILSSFLQTNKQIKFNSF